MTIIQLGLDHKRATIPILESAMIPHNQNFATNGLEESLLIQTCNRVEIYCVAENDFKDSVQAEVISQWKKKSKSATSPEPKDFEALIERNYDSDAVRHILRVTAGLESMVLGEDQILGQVKSSLVQARLAGSIGPVLSLLFECAIKFGGKIRRETNINKGSVSFGSATAKLAEQNLGTLEEKSCLLIGAGEVSMLVAKSLKGRRTRKIYVASRTLERARAMTNMSVGTAIEFADVPKRLSEVDLVVVATKASYPLLTRVKVEDTIRSRQSPLLIIDLSNPTNVESSIGSLPKVNVLYLDDLKDIISNNLSIRMKDMHKIDLAIEEESERIGATLSYEGREPLIASIFKDAEQIRTREVEKAMRHLKEASPNNRKVIEDMSRAIMEGILERPSRNLRRAAQDNKEQALSIGESLFQDQ